MNLKKIIREEMEDFGFVNNMPELHGVSFKVNGVDRLYTITDNGDRYHIHVTRTNDDGTTITTIIRRSVAMKYFRNGHWKTIV